ncbi:hypothetical protein EC3006_5280 [Escherichia coli 3006]|nr:hypothetical protein EC3006_5280 [Escherichia coli 3006]
MLTILVVTSLTYITATSIPITKKALLSTTGWLAECSKIT